MEENYERMIQGLEWALLEYVANKSIQIIEKSGDIEYREERMEILTSNIYKAHLLRYS